MKASQRGSPRFLALFSTDGTPPPSPRSRRVLPRRNPRQQPRADRAGRWRPDRLLPHPAPGRTALRLAHSRALPDGEPLPPARRDPAAEPRRGNAGPERRLRPQLQRTTQKERSRLRPPLLVKGDRVGRSVRGDRRVHRQQSPPPRVRPPARTMALDVRPRGRCGRFASCLTTPTS